MKVQCEYGVAVFTAKSSKDRDYLTFFYKHLLDVKYPHGMSACTNMKGQVIDLTIHVLGT